jgi:hypothetical protein
LRGEWDVADFIQKQRTSFGRLKTSLAGIHRTGKCAAFVSEQLAFQQRLRDGGAVKRDKGPLRSRPMKVDRPRNQFLASSAFTPQQHSGLTVADTTNRLIDLRHGRALADEIGLKIRCPVTISLARLRMLKKQLVGFIGNYRVLPFKTDISQRS